MYSTTLSKQSLNISLHLQIVKQLLQNFAEIISLRSLKHDEIKNRLTLPMTVTQLALLSWKELNTLHTISKITNLTHAMCVVLVPSVYIYAPIHRYTVINVNKSDTYLN